MILAYCDQINPTLGSYSSSELAAAAWMMGQTLQLVMGIGLGSSRAVPYFHGGDCETCGLQDGCLKANQMTRYWNELGNRDGQSRTAVSIFLMGLIFVYANWSSDCYLACLWISARSSIWALTGAVPRIGESFKTSWGIEDSAQSERCGIPWAR